MMGITLVLVFTPDFIKIRKCILNCQVKSGMKLHIEAKKALIVYCLITAAVIATVVGIYLWGGEKGFAAFIESGPITDLSMALFYAAAAWILFGVFLLLAAGEKITRSNVYVVVAFFFVAFIYLNFLRERMLFGDVIAYIDAAFNLYHNQSIHPRYLYPPFWATLLQFFVPLGREAMADLIKVLNYISLLVFYWLLYGTCRRFQISEKVSALMVFVLLAVNVPVLRTLGYGQINIHVANLILLALLFYPRYLFFSAFALALAVHLKISPVILILPFLLNRNWKWLGYFLSSLLGVVCFTSVVNDISYYKNLYFLKNISAIVRSAGTISYRDNSFDSFFRATFSKFGLELQLVPLFSIMLKVLLILFVLFLLRKAIRQEFFFQGEMREVVVMNSFVILLLLMTMLSPLLWCHQFVFFIFPFLVFSKILRGGTEWMIYIIAHFSIFLMPVIDFYPFSYHRLLGILLCLVLLYRVLFFKTLPNKSGFSDS